MAKTQWVLLKVTVPDDASDPDIVAPDVLDAAFTEAGEGYAVELVISSDSDQPSVTCDYHHKENCTTCNPSDLRTWLALAIFRATRGHKHPANGGEHWNTANRMIPEIRRRFGNTL